jgi:L-fuconolactonase
MATYCFAKVSFAAERAGIGRGGIHARQSSALLESNRGDYGWLTPDVGSIYQRFHARRSEAEMRRAGITRGRSLFRRPKPRPKPSFFWTLAAETDFVAGVVGWLDLDPMTSPNVLRITDKIPCSLASGPCCRGLTDDDYIVRPQVLKSLKAIAALDMPFDILTFTRHLPFVTRALARNARPACGRRSYLEA